MLNVPGAEFSKTELKFYGENNRGVIAKASAKKGERVIKIPYSKLISEDVVKTTPIGKSIMNNPNLRDALHFGGNSHLAAYILQEKEKSLN